MENIIDNNDDVYEKIMNISKRMNCSQYIVNIPHNLENRMLCCSRETTIPVDTIIRMSLCQFLTLYEKDVDND